MMVAVRQDDSALERVTFSDPPYQTKKTLRLIRISRISDSNFRCWAGAWPVIEG